MDPRHISIEDYNYSLPDDRIAWHPLAERDQSRLLVYKEGIVAEDIYQHIANYIPSDSLVVFNDTRVVEARLRFRKASGAEIEIFCLEPAARYPDISTAMQEKESVDWCCLIGGRSKWKEGQTLEMNVSDSSGDFLLTADFLGKENAAFLVKLRWGRSDLSFAEVLHLAGSIPLPPYIRRAAQEEDAERYQTIYARQEGSVAAPTAGLHFTTGVLDSLREKGIATAYSTLHVGAGTFQPVKAARMEEHPMHAEFLEIHLDTIRLLSSKTTSPVIAVGTTSLRTLESIYWLGCLAHHQQLDPARGLGQWDGYPRAETPLSKETALRALEKWMVEHNENKLITRTRILIAPGYRFRMIDGLVTNFHQPSSTLLLLVAALIGPGWRDLYNEALQRGFRFLSYGDGSLLFRQA